ncbi:MAG: peptidylprolyl isomerase [Methylotetracoccus sp.]
MKTLFPLLAVCGVALWACNQGAGGKSGSAGGMPLPQVTRGDSAALVNGRPISKLSVDQVESELAQRRGADSVSKEKIIDELIKREVLRQEAEKQSWIAEPAVAARLDNAVRMVLSQIAAENLIKQFSPTDEEIKQEYARRVGEMKEVEYKARHILVDSEKTALDVMKRLSKGEDFAALAKKYSKDPGSKNSGGELGWFGPQQMVPPFSSAVAALKNGETTQTPVKSDFGWHIIQREDSREQPPPALESVKEQILSYMQTDRLHKHIEDLKTKANVERLVQYQNKTAPADAPPPPEVSSPAGKNAPNGSMEAGTPQKPTTPPASGNAAPK